MASITPRLERVIIYVDGFNLYFGMLEAGYINTKWLDIKHLSGSILQPGQVITHIKYFTSRVSNDPAKQKRQTLYLEALETQGIQIFYGHYQTDSVRCKRCLATWPKYNEKMTDVNIATHILVDAHLNIFDTAILISGDSDLVPPIEAIHSLFDNKRVFVAFPPKRHNKSVEKVAKGSLVIGRKKLIDSQFPPVIIKNDGFKLVKPREW